MDDDYNVLYAVDDNDNTRILIASVLPARSDNQGVSGRLSCRVIILGGYAPPPLG
ncbi:hypothetical protein ACH4GK_39995 [Streptomyces rimosus]|uniref:hypothetical protein n=1 Tax=Streptomyces rimosus TaxID=1927 RepID=UPI00131C213F|nr:hypothetical protein [Streptomyces rimosus]